MCTIYKLVGAKFKREEEARSVLCTPEQSPSKPTTQRKIVQILRGTTDYYLRTTPQRKDIVSVCTPYNLLFCAELELVRRGC